VLSQSIKVTGTVTDKKGPLPGVSIMVKGANLFSITGIDGKFSINVPDGNAILVFSFAGFETREIEIGEISIFDIELRPKPKKSKYLAISAGASRFGTIWLGEAEGSSLVLGVDAAYFFKKGFGVGIKVTSSMCNVEIVNKGLSGIDVVNFLGPALYGRFGSNRLAFIVSAGAGILTWSYDRRLGYDYYSKFDGIQTTISPGGFISAGINCMITKKMGIGLNIQSTIGSSNYDFERNPTAIGGTLGLNFRF